MEFDPHDQDIIRLLTKLKDIPGEYPENLLMARRQVFLKRIPEIDVGHHGGTGGGNSAGHTKLPKASSTTSAFLETALIAAIVVEASAMAYFYRDKVADFIQTFKVNPRVEEVTPQPRVSPSWELQGVSPSPAIVSTATPATLTGTTTTPISTFIPEVAGNNSTTTPEVSSTPDLKGNNGHHYGQTPKPERTKVNNGNKDKPPKKEDKPPKGKDDKPPKEDKPPKNK